MSKTAHLAEMDRALMLASVSHDLRTPLTKLCLSLGILQSADLELLTSADRQVTRIETMLAQFLKYARRFSEEETQAIDLNTLLHEALESSLYQHLGQI